MAMKLRRSLSITDISFKRSDETVFSTVYTATNHARVKIGFRFLWLSYKLHAGTKHV